jgi:simple sugar transport system permease protein
MITSLVLAALRLTVPLGLAALGGVVSERSGVIALHLEGVMLMGAFAAAGAAAASGSAGVGLMAGVIAGALVGLLHAFLTQRLKTPPILSGVGINLGALGLTTFALRKMPEALESAPLLPAALMIPLTVVAVAAVWFVLTRTPIGLRLRACGENPKAATAAGVSVGRIRYGAALAAGALAGLGGVSLALVGLGAFTENMTAGRGYIALAAVIFGRWNPLGAAGAALLFGLGDALQVTLQTQGWAATIPPDMLTLLPYLVTLLALIFFRGGSSPAALGENQPDTP